MINISSFLISIKILGFGASFIYCVVRYLCTEMSANIYLLVYRICWAPSGPVKMLETRTRKMEAGARQEIDRLIILFIFSFS